MEYKLENVYSVESYDPNIKLWLVIFIDHWFDSFKEFFDTKIILHQQYKKIESKYLTTFDIETLDKNSKLYKSIKLKINLSKLKES